MSLPTLPTNRRFLTRLFNSLAAPPPPPPPAPSSPDATTSLTDSDRHHPNPLDSVPPAVKKQLLSLQVLFPTEFLPALDVLDRRLVTRLRIRNPPSPSAHRQDRDHHEDMYMRDDATLKDATPTWTAKHTSPPHRQAASTTTCVPVDVATPAYDDHNTSTKPAIYYVQSARYHRPSRYSSTSYSQAPTYQVRLTTWSCSCPAFTFAAFPATPSPPSTPPLANQDDDDEDEDDSTAHDHRPCLFGGTTLGDDMPPVCKHLLACLLAEKSKNLFGHFVTDKWVTLEEAAGWAAGWGD